MHKNYRHSQETKRKISLRLAKPKIKITCEICKKELYVKLSRKNARYCSKKCHGISLKGKPPRFAGSKHTEETKKKISDKLKGRIFTEEHKRKIGLATKRQIPTMLGKHHTEETKLKMSLKQKGKKFSIQHRKNLRSALIKTIKNKKENHSNWQGGITPEKYPNKWGEILREKIRKRDNYKCQICGCPQKECLAKLSVHHIDYNKENIVYSNLISLCTSCHMKTNFNRKFWKMYSIKRRLEVYVSKFLEEQLLAIKKVKEGKDGA